ncbi:MAG: sulfur carrier protein ThiS [Thermodesulfobacteriota bacterium]|jgi:thiamine biosynthesis protein ThiS
MRVTVNGEDRELPEGTTLSELLAQLGVNRAAVVVERNGRVVGREEHDAVCLGHRDRLEIVRFVAGG